MTMPLSHSISDNQKLPTNKNGPIIWIKSDAESAMKHTSYGVQDSKSSLRELLICSEMTFYKMKFAIDQESHISKTCMGYKL
jgi:hypothetical protein